ncbi:hypothetical protein SK629_0046 [Streptococcus mitis]|uniref:Uncharacterized protein n=1 Tax=Streptococcus mitis TaxID=28037 RepID=A0A081Q6R8_STRMT|nr:hypothetical protein SK629_0046 [Streptococcus mitis]
MKGISSHKGVFLTFFEKIAEKFKKLKKTLDKSCKYLYTVW